MTETISIGKNSKMIFISISLNVIKIIICSLFIALMARFAIPLSFIALSVTLQTLAISIISIFFKKKEVVLAVIFYLFLAFCGFPVLQNGQSNPLWVFSPTAGYLFGFFMAAVILPTALTKYKPKHFAKTWLIFALNESTVLLFGTLWLSYYVSITNSLIKGFIPFIPGAVLKITIASLIYSVKSKVKIKNGYKIR